MYHTFIKAHSFVVEAKTDLQNQLTTLSSSQSSTSSEVETLRRRVEDTEREKRDLVGVVSRLKDEAMQRDGQNNNHMIQYGISHFCFRGDSFASCKS